MDNKSSKAISQLERVQRILQKQKELEEKMRQKEAQQAKGTISDDC